MRTKYLMWVLISVMYTIPLLPNDGSGGQAGAFLRRGLGSEALSMGNAYTSVAKNASSIYWNPAGLSYIQETEMMAMVSFLTLDRKEMFFSLGHTFPGLFSLGLGWYEFGIDGIDGRDGTGHHTRTFSDSQRSFMLSMSKDISFLSFGLTGKYLHHTLHDYSASGMSFDVGVKATYNDMITVGIVGQDLLGSYRWNTEDNTEEDIPITLRAGISYYPAFLPGVLSFDVVQVENEDMLFRVGTLYKVIEYFGVSAGYNANDVTFGAFFKLPTESFSAQLDYAATRDIVQNNYVHHITLLIHFH